MMTKYFVIIVVALALAGRCYSQGSDQKETILRAREAAKVASKNQRECAKMGFPAAAQDNRCFVIYPSDITTWGKGFSDGLAKVTVDGKVGFIDKRGRLVIPAKFNDAGSFSEGLAPFETSKGKWGYIDRSGTIVIPAKFDWAISFNEERALVQVGKLWGYIDQKGDLLVPAKFQEAESYSEGLAAVGFYDTEVEWAGAAQRKGKWVRYFIDKDGKQPIQSSFDIIHRDFNGGMAIVSRDLGYSEKFKGMISETYVIDRAGKELWVLHSPSIYWFSDDVIPVETKRTEKIYDSLYSFLNRNGERLCDSEFENPSGFSEGLASVRVNGKYGFIDKTCKFVIEPRYDGAGSFSEGLASVSDESGKIGFIDKSGKWIIRPQFKWTAEFSEDGALILDGDRSGYIDRSGNVIWAPSK